MQLRTNDGKTYRISGSAITPVCAAVLVAEMRQDSRTPSNSMEEFMQQVAHRCNLQNGAIVQTSDPQVFVNDLLRLGFLTVMEM